MQKIFGPLPQRQSGTSPLFLRACSRSCSRRLTGILALTALSVAIPALAQDATTSVLELDTVTIKATYPRPEEIQQALTPGGVTIVGDEKLQESPVGNLTDSVRYVPGVWAPGSGNSDDARISIRGSNLDATDYDNNGVMLLQDGLPVSSADGNNHNRFPDPLAAQRMIVMRGANALTYGASELGGAINFVSRTASSSDPMQLSVDGGSFGLRSARVSVGAAGETLDGLLTVEGKHDSGWREHSRQKRRSVYGNVGLRVSPDIDLRFYATHIDNEQQLAGSITRAAFEQDRRQADPSNVVGDHQFNVRSNRLASTGQWRINATSRLDFGLSYEEQALYHPIVYSPFFSLLINTRQRTLGGMLHYGVLLGDHDIVAGVNLAHSTNRGGNYANDRGLRGQLQDDVDQRATTTAVFALDRWQVAPRWTLVYGAQGVSSRRIDDNVDGINQGNTQARDQRDRFSSLNPRAGAIYALTPSSDLFASVSRVYQAPNSFELNNARSERGPNTTLRAMHGTMVEVGVRGDNAAPVSQIGLNWDVSVYWGRLRNEIVSSDDPAAPGNTLTSNAGHTTHAGIEVLLGGRFPVGAEGSIDPLVSATWNHFTFNRHPQYGSNRLPNAPRYFIHGEVMYRNGQGVYAGPVFDLVGARYADYSNTYKVGSYSLLGLRTGVRRKHWNLFLEARNLLNRRYVDMLGVLEQARPDSAVLNAGVGRSVYAGLRLHY